MLIDLVVECPSSRPFAVEAIRNVCVRYDGCLVNIGWQHTLHNPRPLSMPSPHPTWLSRCLTQLSCQPDVLEALARCLHLSLRQGQLNPEQAATLAQAIARLMQPSNTDHQPPPPPGSGPNRSQHNYIQPN